MTRTDYACAKIMSATDDMGAVQNARSKSVQPKTIGHPVSLFVFFAEQNLWRPYKNHRTPFLTAPVWLFSTEVNEATNSADDQERLSDDCNGFYVHLKNMFSCADKNVIVAVCVFMCT